MAGIAFHGGRILTMDVPAEADVVVTEDDRVVAVGGTDLLDRHPDSTRVDLAGRTLAPGFIDAHNHLSISALLPRWRDVSTVTDREGLVAAIRDQARAEPDVAWVRCADWDESLTGFVPGRHDLDAAGLDRPVIVTHYSLHQAVVSTAALEALGIGRETTDPPGGEIGREADGTPDGLLLERAWSEAHARSLEPYADPDRWAEHIAARARTLLAYGITAVHDAACSPAAERVYEAMARAGEMPVSVLMLPHSASLLSNDPGGRLDGPVTGEGSEWCRVGPVKLFADGGVAIGLDTRIGGLPVQLGMVMDDLASRARDAVARGFGVGVHAIGNLGVEAALDAFEALRDAHADAPRLRLEHAGVTSAGQWRRTAALDVVAVVQPGFVEHVGRQSGGVTFDEHHWLAFAGLAEAGVTLAGSSDDPCAPAAPLWCAHRGVTRRTDAGILLERDQSVPLDDWLRAYTIGAAVAGGQVGERGALVPGARADLVVLDLEVAEDGRVDETWVAGRRVFRREPG
ncbi:MAG: amidohydrolase [Acidimicrobiia bacterium]